MTSFRNIITMLLLVCFGVTSISSVTVEDLRRMRPGRKRTMPRRQQIIIPVEEREEEVIERVVEDIPEEEIIERVVEDIPEEEIIERVEEEEEPEEVESPIVEELRNIAQKDDLQNKEEADTLLDQIDNARKEGIDQTNPDEFKQATDKLKLLLIMKIKELWVYPEFRMQSLVHWRKRAEKFNTNTGTNLLVPVVLLIKSFERHFDAYDALNVALETNDPNLRTPYLRLKNMIKDEDFGLTTAPDELADEFGSPGTEQFFKLPLSKANMELTKRRILAKKLKESKEKGKEEKAPIPPPRPHGRGEASTSRTAEEEEEWVWVEARKKAAPQRREAISDYKGLLRIIAFMPSYLGLYAHTGLIDESEAQTAYLEKLNTESTKGHFRIISLLAVFDTEYYRWDPVLIHTYAGMLDELSEFLKNIKDNISTLDDAFDRLGEFERMMRGVNEKRRDGISQWSGDYGKELADSFDASMREANAWYKTQLDHFDDPSRSLIPIAMPDEPRSAEQLREEGQPRELMRAALAKKKRDEMAARVLEALNVNKPRSPQLITDQALFNDALRVLLRGQFDVALVLHSLFSEKSYEPLLSGWGHERLYQFLNTRTEGLIALSNWLSRSLKRKITLGGAYATRVPVMNSIKNAKDTINGLVRNVMQYQGIVDKEESVGSLLDGISGGTTGDRFEALNDYIQNTLLRGPVGKQLRTDSNHPILKSVGLESRSRLEALYMQ